MARRRAKLLLLVGALLVAFGAAEVASRILVGAKFKTPLIYQPSDSTSFELVPGIVEQHNSREFSVVYRINPQGYRGAPVTLPKPEGQQRVILTGDSFAFGHGVEEAETVGSRLEARLGDDVRVVNAGFASGTAPDDAFAFLASPRAAALDPDVVVELVFMKNDLRDLSEHEWVRVDDQGRPLKVVHPTEGPNRLHGRGPIPIHKSNPILRNLGLAQLAGRAYFALVALPARSKRLAAWADSYLDDHPSGLSPRFETALRGIDDLTRAKGWGLVVGVIPTRKQTEGTPHGLYDAALARLKALLGQLQIRFVVFDEPSSGIGPGDLYPLDSHWKASGHDQAAATLAPLVRAALTSTAGAASAPAASEP